MNGPGHGHGPTTSHPVRSSGSPSTTGHPHAGLRGACPAQVVLGVLDPRARTDRPVDCCAGQPGKH